MPHTRWMPPLLVLFLLMAYTAYKFSFWFPQRKVLCWGLSLLLFSVMVGWQIAYRFTPNPHSPAFQMLAWTGAVGLGLWASFVLMALVFDAAVFLYQGFRLAFPVANLPNPARREWFTRWLPNSLLTLAGGITTAGVFQAVRGPRVVTTEVPIAGLPPQLKGLRIAQITDFHIGPTIGKNYVESVVAAIQALQPDLIAVTGDLVDGRVPILRKLTEPLRQLKAPLGVYYVTGNHEYYWGASEWIEQTQELGFIPLLNENRVVHFQNTKLLVAGVTDTSAHHFNPQHRSNPQQAAQSSEACDFKLLLAHRPDSCFAAEGLGFHLQLSGHTHAGQFFPFRFLIPLVHKYYRGLNRHKEGWVYVNVGTGYWGPPHRFSVPSEISLLRLV